MAEGPVEFLSPEWARQMVELAERARAGLVSFSGQDVGYDSAALHLLDEWIERMPSPSQELRLLWVAFLGEIFRRRHSGEWVIHQENGRRLAVLCPTDSGGVHRVEVATQVANRLANGLADSLALFYARESILLRQPRDL
ncbi:MAG TPA: hypothetical protein ENI37_01935 [Chloroflexi bacterium]|nr:hypothetical protein [Chloroflexota bacterium]